MEKYNFLIVFTKNMCFSVKSKLTTFSFEESFDIS
jgi:hypothetical protein